MDTGKPEQRNWLLDGLRDYMDLNNVLTEEKPTESIRFMSTENLDVPRRVGNFTVDGVSFQMR